VPIEAIFTRTIFDEPHQARHGVLPWWPHGHTRVRDSTPRQRPPGNPPWPRTRRAGTLLAMCAASPALFDTSFPGLKEGRT
jgi:hypothetical protein